MFFAREANTKYWVWRSPWRITSVVVREIIERSMPGKLFPVLCYCTKTILMWTHNRVIGRKEVGTWECCSNVCLISWKIQIWRGIRSSGNHCEPKSRTQHTQVRRGMFVSVHITMNLKRYGRKAECIKTSKCLVWEKPVHLKSDPLFRSWFFSLPLPYSISFRWTMTEYMLTQADKHW